MVLNDDIQEDSLVIPMKDQTKPLSRTNSDPIDSCKRSGFLKRQQKLQNLADQIGLDGIAMCANEDDLMLHPELNTYILTKQ